MKDLRDHVALPLDVDLSERACADLVTRLAAHIAPGLERSVGPVHWTEGETTGVDWTAEGFVEGALVVVCLRASSREVSLLVDPTFVPPSQQAATTPGLLLGILGTSVAVGATRRSVWWAVLFLVGTVFAWIVTDVVRQTLKIRRATRTLDRAGWSRRFQDGIIPPWSGQHGFHGYARDCVGEGPVAWALPAGSTLIRRFETAAAFWQAWNGDAWPEIQSSIIQSVERALGRHSNYYAIDGGSWPPRALLRIATAMGPALVTVGVSILPQPNIETDDASELRRIELGVLLPAQWDDASVERFAGYISGQAGLPWSRFTSLGQGHTIPCDCWSSPRFGAALLVRDYPPLSLVSLPRQFSDPVSLLWFIPISEEERAYAIAHGSSALSANLPHSRWSEA